MTNESYSSGRVDPEREWSFESVHVVVKLLREFRNWGGWPTQDTDRRGQDVPFAFVIERQETIE
jgi:hypothetical protein